MANKLRIAILTQSDFVPEWFYQMLSKIKQSSYGEIVLLIEDNSFYKKKNYLVYDFYRKLDRKYFKKNPNASEKKSINSLFKVESIALEDTFSIEKYNIDIIIQLERKSNSIEILNIAKYGIWSYHFSDFNKSLETPDLFWEVIERRGEVGITLAMQTSFENKVLATSYSLTDNLSVERSLNSYLWKAVSILPKKIEELYKLGEEQFFKKNKELNFNSDFFKKEIENIPSNGKVIFSLMKFKWKRFQNIIRSFFYFDQWILLFHLDDTETISTDFSHFKKILPPKGRFWADPHVIKKNGIYYIFIEELIYTENKGFISVIEMDSKGNYKDPVKILETGYHLSFPFIIEDNDEIYMIPESKQNNNIQLYKCIDFPYKWEMETILMDNVKAVDTVITKKDDKYWLFTNMIENSGASLYDELYLFSSDSLVSTDWKSHPENPIVSDVKNARLAGKLYIYNTNLYRPSQNCSNHYGYGMKINKVLKIDNNDYKEEIVESIFPDWDKNIVSTHSLTYVDKLTVIDAQFKRRK